MRKGRRRGSEAGAARREDQARGPVHHHKSTLLFVLDLFALQFPLFFNFQLVTSLIVHLLPFEKAALESAHI